MKQEFDLQRMYDVAITFSSWAHVHVFSAASAAQVVVTGFTFLLAYGVAKFVRAAIAHALGRWLPEPRFDLVRRWSTQVLVPAVWLLLQGFAVHLAGELQQPNELLRVVASLLAAWVVIRTTSNLVSDPFWSRTVAVIAWTIAALNVLHLLEPTASFLDSLAFFLGATRISVYTILKGLALTGVLLWGAFAASAALRRRIERLPRLTPSVQVLMAQTLKFALVTLAVVVALGSVGIDLTAFALFSGAVGVGVGFGLQKVVSNLISGIILLLDRSIKPGDVVEVAGTFGWVSSLGARYASVVTRDGTEHLIPNELLITQAVVNWSYSNRLIRRRLSIGVSYDADVDLATELMIAAVRETNRVLDDPPPQCYMVGFGDSSVNFELRFWLADPREGVSNVADCVLRKVWQKFREHGVQIPYPQRDLHLRTPPVLQVATQPAGMNEERAGEPDARS